MKPQFAWEWTSADARSKGMPMGADKTPQEFIQELFAQRDGRSDAEVLEEIEGLPALADGDDPAWDDEGYWREIAYLYVALSDVAAQRKLRPAVRLLLERACNGDPGEMMRGLRHALERVFNPDWSALADVCIELASSTRPGTRRWALDQLMILDDPRARPIFNEAMNDEIGEIRRIAVSSVQRLDRILR